MDRPPVDREPKRLNRRLLAGAAALAVLAIGGSVAVFQGRGEPSAEEVAMSFVEAYGALDAEAAISHLADDADIAAMVASVGAQGVEGTLGEFRLLISSNKSRGYKQMR